MADKDTEFGDGVLQGLKETLAWKRGEVALEIQNIDPIPASSIKEIRKHYSRSTK